MKKVIQISAATILTVFGILVQASISFGQQNNSLQNMNFDFKAYLKTTSATVYERVTDGSPWLLSYWCAAGLVDAAGVKYWGPSMKVDLVRDKLIFLEQGAEMELVIPVQQMKIVDNVANDTVSMVRPEYLKLKDPKISGWLKLYESGEATLVLDMDKRLEEYRAFNSAVKEYRVIDKFSWLIILDGTPYHVKKLKEAEALLLGKKPGLKSITYQSKGLEGQLKELVRTYNKQS